MSLLTRVSAEAAGVDAVGRAAIAYVSALVHLAAGDLNAAERDLSETLVLARGARDPQRAIRAWLLRAEIERGRERPAAALSQLQRIGRVIAAAPPIVRARWELAKALSMPGPQARDGHLDARPGPPASARSRSISRPARRFSALQHGVASMADPFADELVAILRVCQTAADEGELLKTVCARLRQHLHAAAVAFVSVRGERLDLIAVRRRPSGHGHRRARRLRRRHHRPSSPSGSDRGGGADRVRRRADRRALCPLDDRIDLRHVAGGVGPDDERGGGVADAGRGDGAAGARRRRRRRPARPDRRR